MNAMAYANTQPNTYRPIAKIEMEDKDYYTLNDFRAAANQISGAVSRIELYNNNTRYLYIVDDNDLTIYRNRGLIYANHDGAICRDRDALADCHN